MSSRTEVLHQTTNSPNFQTKDNFLNIVLVYLWINWDSKNTCTHRKTDDNQMDNCLSNYGTVLQRNTFLEALCTWSQPHQHAWLTFYPVIHTGYFQNILLIMYDVICSICFFSVWYLWQMVSRMYFLCPVLYLPTFVLKRLFSSWQNVLCVSFSLFTYLCPKKLFSSWCSPCFWCVKELLSQLAHITYHFYGRH